MVRLSTDIGRFSGTVLEPGTLYGALARLEQAGWIVTLPAEDRRRPYQLTAAGETALRSQVETLSRVVTAAAGRLAPA